MEEVQDGVRLFGVSHSSVGFASDDARERAIIEQMPMVKALAKSVQNKLPQHVEIDDLLSAGVLGLIEAANRFDTSLGVAFSTFAYNRVRGAIFDSLRGEDAASQSMREKGKRLEKAVNRLSAIFGRIPTEAELASFLQISIKEYRLLVQKLWMLNIRSANEEASSERGCDGRGARDLLINLIPDRSTPDQQSCIEQGELIDRMHQAIDSLSERQKTVISLYYYREMTMSQISKIVGVNESCVSKTHAKALLNLKAAMRDASRADRCRPGHQPGTKAPMPMRASHNTRGQIAAFRKRA